MSLENDLIDWYNANEDKVLNFEATERTANDESTTVLLPIFAVRSTVNVHVVLNMDGSFRYAETAKITKPSGKGKMFRSIILPATQDSAGRTNKEAPMPLFDKMEYVSGDETMPGYDEAKHKLYMTLLGGFAKYANEHNYPYIDLIFSYLNKNTIYNDIPQELHQYDTKKDKNDKSNKKRAITFVYFDFYTDEGTFELWKDKRLYELWKDHFYNNVYGGEVITDWFTGEKQKRVFNFNKKLLYSAIGCKLFSMNNSDQFSGSYFSDGKELTNNLVPIGIISEQKIANALRYLYYNNCFSFSRYFGGKNDAFNQRIQVIIWGIDKNTINNISDNNFDEDEFLSMYDDIEESVDSMSQEADKFSKKLHGYLTKKISDDVHMLMMADTSPGRLAIANYSIGKRDEIIANLDKWQEDGKVPVNYFHDKGNGKKECKTIFASPRVTSYANVCALNDAELITISNKIMYNMMFGKQIPRNIVNMAVGNTNKMRYGCRKNTEHISSEKDYDKWLSTKLYPTCSLIMHYLNFHKDEKEYVTMALDTNCKDKNYILGRIVALADQAEKAYNHAKTGKYMNRATHATDIAAVITRHPAIGFHRLNESLAKYKALAAKTNGYLFNLYNDEIEEIEDIYGDVLAGLNNSPVSNMYYIGLASQTRKIKADIKDRKEKKAKEKEETVSK